MLKKSTWGAGEYSKHAVVQKSWGNCMNKSYSPFYVLVPNLKPSPTKWGGGKKAKPKNNKDLGLLGCNAMSMGEWCLFQRKVENH